MTAIEKRMLAEIKRGSESITIFTTSSAMTPSTWRWFGSIDEAGGRLPRKAAKYLCRTTVPRSALVAGKFAPSAAFELFVSRETLARATFWFGPSERIGRIGRIGRGAK